MSGAINHYQCLFAWTNWSMLRSESKHECQRGRQDFGRSRACSSQVCLCIHFHSKHSVNYYLCSTFIVAGQDTTSHALSRLLHLLATHPEVQSRLREEIVHAREECNGQEFDYDTLMGLPYLDAICRETLRVFPPITHVMRL